MQPFIPERESAYFQAFLERIGLAGVHGVPPAAPAVAPAPGVISATSPPPPPDDAHDPRATHTFSEDLSATAARLAREAH